MEETVLCLNWNEYGTNLKYSLNRLFENELLADVSFACEGKIVKAHKIVLLASSPYFEEILKLTPCKHPIIFLKDVPYKTFRSLIKYMYCGEVDVTYSEVKHLLELAQSLKIKGLCETEVDFSFNDRIQNEETSSTPIGKSIQTDLEDADMAVSNQGLVMLHPKSVPPDKMKDDHADHVPQQCEKDVVGSLDLSAATSKSHEHQPAKRRRKVGRLKEQESRYLLPEFSKILLERIDKGYHGRDVYFQLVNETAHYSVLRNGTLSREQYNLLGQLIYEQFPFIGTEFGMYPWQVSQKIRRIRCRMKKNLLKESQKPENLSLPSISSEHLCSFKEEHVAEVKQEMDVDAT